MKQLEQMNSTELKALLFDIGEQQRGLQMDYEKVYNLMIQIIREEEAIRMKELEAKNKEEEVKTTANDNN